MFDSLQPHEPQHTRPPCPSPTPRVLPNPYPSSRWCYPTISSSVFPFSSCLQSFPASGSFQMSQLFTSGGQSIGVSASTSVLPMNAQDWSLGWTGWISLQSRGLSRVFSNTTVQKHQFFGRLVFLKILLLYKTQGKSIFSKRYPNIANIQVVFYKVKFLCSLILFPFSNWVNLYIHKCYFQYNMILLRNSHFS